ncbi:hypothetical protein BO71DRAFT_394373 [Aspergillus ellipticus CBS 707.79]|uniref:Translation initiation factor 3 N-terminal domain-containing protein n=1 Tax=Aspergillus ellipticus CBS 707.79 TaxID=1448320 RepID=A0A319EET7_9EURO|nr:hypothetical protein BO71DRAFT_394373 [Aspergillus ellipticus CBS 707.79]
MNHTRSLCPPTRALRQLFLAPQPIVRPQCGRLDLRINATPARCYSPTASLGRIYAKPSNIIPPTPQDRDEAIRAPFVQIVNEANTLDEPIRLRDALRRVDRSVDCLVKVAPGVDGIPVCKILNKYELSKQTREKAKPQKDNLKQIEVNWAISAHDLQHRMKQLETFLAKGRKVELSLTRKKGKRAPTVEEVKALMNGALATIKSTNSMLVRPMEGEPGKHVLLVLVRKDLA